MSAEMRGVDKREVIERRMAAINFDINSLNFSLSENPEHRAAREEKITTMD
jgi:hypothetical protein